MIVKFADPDEGLDRCLALLAARISGHAEPGEVLVSGPLRDAVGLSRFVWDELGAITLKGVGDPEPVLRARSRASDDGPDRPPR